MEPLWVLMRILAFVFAVVLSFILYRVATGAYAQYKSGPAAVRWKPRGAGGYKRIPLIRVNDEDEDEGYHDAESFEIQRSPKLDLQKPLPERPLPDKPLPNVPGGD